MNVDKWMTKCHFLKRNRFQSYKRKCSKIKNITFQLAGKDWVTVAIHSLIAMLVNQYF